MLNALRTLVARHAEANAPPPRDNAASFVQQAGSFRRHWGENQPISDQRRQRAVQGFATRQLVRVGLPQTPDMMALQLRLMQNSLTPPASPDPARGAPRAMQPVLPYPGMPQAEWDAALRYRKQISKGNVHELGAVLQHWSWYKALTETDAASAGQGPQIQWIALDGEGHPAPPAQSQVVFSHQNIASERDAMQQLQFLHRRLLAVSPTYRKTVRMAASSAPVRIILSDEMPLAGQMSDAAGRNLIAINAAAVMNAGQTLEKALVFEMANAAQEGSMRATRLLAERGAFERDAPHTPRSISALRGAERVLARGPDDAAAVRFAGAIEMIEWMSSRALKAISEERAQAGLGALPVNPHRPAWFDAIARQGVAGNTDHDLDFITEAIVSHSQAYLDQYDRMADVDTGQGAMVFLRLEAAQVRQLPVFLPTERAAAEQRTRAIYTTPDALPDLIGAALQTDIRREIMNGTDAERKRVLCRADGGTDRQGLTVFEHRAIARARSLVREAGDAEQDRILAAVIRDMFPRYKF